MADALASMLRNAGGTTDQCGELSSLHLPGDGAADRERASDI